ncbi:MAG: hypothetical protein M9948_10570 [Lentimicrobium sp.]|nr:hypothetical protein [Lentimicrobium sp.]
MKEKQSGRIIYAPGSFNARGQMLQYALSIAGIHTAIAGGITYGADALINNSAFNWKAYGMNIATSMAMAGLSYQKPGAQHTNYSLADIEAGGITDPRRGYGMRFGDPPGYVKVSSEEGLIKYNIPGTEIVSTSIKNEGMSLIDIANTFFGAVQSPFFVMQNVANIPGGDKVVSNSFGRFSNFIGNASFVSNAGYYYFSDGKFSIGDGARVVSNLAYNTPYVGKVYMAVDIGFGIDGYSLTDRFGDWIDYHLGDYRDVDGRFFIQKR